MIDPRLHAGGILHGDAAVPKKDEYWILAWDSATASESALTTAKQQTFLPSKDEAGANFAKTFG